MTRYLPSVYSWNGTSWDKSGHVAHRNQGTWTVYPLRFSPNGSSWDVYSAIPLVPPSIVRNFRTSTFSTTTIQLDWTAPATPADISGYNIRWLADDVPGSDTDGELLANLSTEDMQYLHGGLAADVNIGYGIFGVTATGGKGPMATAMGTTSIVLPSEPENFAVAPSGTTGILLSWTPPATLAGMTGYKIRWAPTDPPISDTDGTFLVDLADTATSYLHSGLTPGQEVGYYLYAYSGSGSGTGATAQGASVLPPSTPLNFTAGGVDTTIIGLSWDPPDTPGDMTMYEIRRKTGSAPTSNFDGTLVAQVATTEGTYNVTGLTTLTTYGFRIFGFTGDGSHGSAATTTGMTL